MLTQELEYFLLDTLNYSKYDIIKQLIGYKL